MHVFPPKADQIRTKPLFRELQAKLSDDESITVGTNYKPLDGSFPEPVDDKSLESSTSKHLIKSELRKSRLENIRSQGGHRAGDPEIFLLRMLHKQSFPDLTCHQCPCQGKK